MFRYFVCVLGVLGFVSAAHAAPKYYEGKTMEFVISNGVGGGFDLYGRTFAKYYSKYLPGNPKIIVKNVQGFAGASGIRYTLARNVTDGTHVNLVQPSQFLWSAVGAAPYVDTRKIRFIGSLTRDVWIVVADRTKVRSWEDLMLHHIGVTDARSDGAITARLLRHILKKNYKLVAGYKKNPDILLAIERGEVTSATGHTYSTTSNKRPYWFDPKSKFGAVLVESTFNSAKTSELPMITSLAKDPDTLDLIKFVQGRYDIGRPVWAVPGTPDHIMKMLRDAFDKTVQDPMYKRDMKKRKLQSAPASAKELDAVVAKMYSTKKSIVETATSIVTGK